MNKRTAVGLLAIGAVWLSGALAWGQMTVPRLTDADVKRIIPVMKAEAAQTQADLKQLEQDVKRGEEYFQLREQLLKDMETGKVDPLAYLKQQSKYILAPPSAVYKPKLSRYVSVNLYYGDPTAVFSYGIEASETLKTLARGGEAAAVQLVTFGDVYNGPNGKKIKAVYDEFVSFYTAKGFSHWWSETMLEYGCVSPDGRAGAVFWHPNIYAGIINVENIPDGPILLLGVAFSSSADERPRPMGSRVPMSKETALRLIGMSEEEYGEYVGALVMARNDAADPSAIDPANMGLDFEGPVDPETAKALKEMRVFYELRRQNMLIYKKYAAVLDPLFAAMGQ
jgi:hypothetical protein